MSENNDEHASNRLAAETFMPIMVEAFHDGLHEVASLSRWLLATLVVVNGAATIAVLPLQMAGGAKLAAAGAFVFGILANPGVQWDKEQREPRSNALIWRPVPVLLGLVLIGFVWPRWPGEAESEAARLAFLKQSYALAIYHSLQAIRHGNEDPDTLYYLAESRRQLGNGFEEDFRSSHLST